MSTNIFRGHDPPPIEGPEELPADNYIKFWMRLFWEAIRDHQDSELTLLSDTFLLKNRVLSTTSWGRSHQMRLTN